MNWSALALAAPELAALGSERLLATRVCLLGTLRDDGAPRISPVEPYLVRGELLFGVMKSANAMDLARDPRCAVHSSVSKSDGSEGEFKLFGTAVEVTDPTLRSAEPEAWWMSFHPGSAVVYRLEIARRFSCGGISTIRRSRPCPGQRPTEASEASGVIRNGLDARRMARRVVTVEW